MTETNDNDEHDFSLEESAISKYIKQWKDNERTSGFNPAELLTELAECMERETTEFWSRDPDPFDERIPKKVPVAGAYADIYNDLIMHFEFVFNLIIKYVTPISRPEEQPGSKLTLRFLCSVLNCCSLSIFFTEYDTETKEQFYNRIFEWALADNIEPIISIYATYIAGHITKEDDQVIPQRKITYINLISKTMSRLESLNRSSRGNMRSNWRITRSNNFLLDEGSNASVRDLSMSEICGVWNLCSPMREATQQRLLIYFLRHIAEFETLMPSIYTSGILPLMTSWLSGERHDDIRLMFEALRLLMKLLCHRVIYIEFYERMDGINLLLSIPRPSVAANAISFCLYNLLCYVEIVDKVIQLKNQNLEHLLKVLLYIIETCHPSARCYGMLCIQCLIRQPVTLNIFEKLNGPRYILNSLAILPSMLGVTQNKSARKDFTYIGLLKTTLNTIKINLEQSLINWSQNTENVDDTGLLVFPSESETPFSKKAVNYIPIAMKLQSWKHPYLSERSNIIKVIYSNPGFFEDSFNNFHDVINSCLDILSLLCVSNKFVVRFLDFQENDTKATIKQIFGILLRRPNSVSANHVKALKSVLFFLAILCCRPLQGSRVSTQLNKSSRKRKYEDIENSMNIENIEKVSISNEGIITKVITPTISSTSKQSANFHQELQTQLWNLIRCYNAIPKLLKILEVPLSPLDTVSVRVWVCHVISGMSRCNDILLMLRKLPVFNKGVIENLMNETVTPERMREHAEFCTIARRLIQDLRGQTSTVDKAGDLRLDQVRKMEIVGRTQIQWDSQELLNIIYNHLQEIGYSDVADHLRQRANLPINDRENLLLYEDKSDDKISFSRIPQTPKRAIDNRLNHITSSTPKPISLEPNSAARPKLYRDNINPSNIMTKSFLPPNTGKTTSLNYIVETFLRGQHAQCQNPISICPKFSLNTKHICPSVGELNRPTNILNYINKRSYDSTHHTNNNRMLHRYVHRSFKPRVLLNESDVFADDNFSGIFCFAKGLEDGLFFAGESSSIVFTDVDLAQASVEIGEVHHSPSNLENTKNGRLLMVSSMYTRRNAGVLSLFNVENRCSEPTTMKKEQDYPFSGYSEFSKTNDTKFIITQDKIAQIVDVRTGSVLHTCSNEDNIEKKNYSVNRATFSYDDNLVLSYGTLYDVRCSPRERPVNSFLHGFYNFGDVISGVFHPNGLEVIIGSTVWDIRTYRLLQNVSTLKSSRIIFNERGDFFYTYKDYYSPYASNAAARGESIFQCFDSKDYSVVATVNTNKVIMSLTVDPKDLGVAVIENEEGRMQAQCRVFSVGYKWSTSSSYDIDDDVGGTDDEEDNESDMEFVMDVDINDFMYLSDSDDSTSDDDQVIEENERFLSMSDSDSSESDLTSDSYDNNELEDALDEDDEEDDDSSSYTGTTSSEYD